MKRLLDFLRRWRDRRLRERCVKYACQCAQNGVQFDLVDIYQFILHGVKR